MRALWGGSGASPSIACPNCGEGTGGAVWASCNRDSEAFRFLDIDRGKGNAGKSPTGLITSGESGSSRRGEMRLPCCKWGVRCPVDTESGEGFRESFSLFDRSSLGCKYGRSSRSNHISPRPSIGKDELDAHHNILANDGSMRGGGPGRPSLGPDGFLKCVEAVAESGFGGGDGGGGDGDA